MVKEEKSLGHSAAVYIRKMDGGMEKKKDLQSLWLSERWQQELRLY